MSGIIHKIEHKMKDALHLGHKEEGEQKAEHGGDGQHLKELMHKIKKKIGGRRRGKKRQGRKEGEEYKEGEGEGEEEEEEEEEESESESENEEENGGGDVLEFEF